MDVIDVLEWVKTVLEIITLLISLGVDTPLLGVGLLTITLLWLFKKESKDSK